MTQLTRSSMTCGVFTVFTLLPETCRSDRLLKHARPHARLGAHEEARRPREHRTLNQGLTRTTLHPQQPAAKYQKQKHRVIEIGIAPSTLERRGLSLSLTPTAFPTQQLTTGTHNYPPQASCTSRIANNEPRTANRKPNAQKIKSKGY